MFGTPSWPLWMAGLLLLAALACGSDPTPISTPTTVPTAIAVPAVEPTATAAPATTPASIVTAVPTAEPTVTPPLSTRPPDTPTAAPPKSTPSPTGTVALPPTTGDVEDADGHAAVLGRWEGENTLGPNRIGIIVTCGDFDGELKCKLDVPEQGLTDQGLSNVGFESGRLHFEFEVGVVTAMWDGELQGDTIEGDFGQAGLSGSFRLERASLPVAPGPSDVPGADEKPPYRQEEVEFHNGQTTLAGTLTLPESAGLYAAVVLVSGSGLQDRDSELAGFPIFKAIAEHLTLSRHGIAVLRYDDPGVGDSTGDALQETIPDRADNVLAAVDLLLQHPEIDPERIGLIGHSEGGIVAPLVASLSEHISFIVLLAGTGVRGDEILRAQLEFLIKDASEEEAERARAQQERLFRVLASGEGWDEFAETTRQAVLESIEAAPASERAAITDVEVYVDTVVEQQLKAVRRPWYKSFFEYDPGPVLEQLTLPVLALFGGLDSQVPAIMNATAIKEALTAANNTEFTLSTFPKANHLFQAATTGEIGEYAELEGKFVPGFLEFIEEWVSTQTDKQ